MSMHTGMCHPRNAAELLHAARSGDRSAWEELVLRYSGVVRSAVSEFRLQESDAADVVQNTWLRLLVHAATIRDPRKLGGWLSTTAKREALAVIRRSRPEIASESAGDGLPAPGPSPEEVVILAETRAAVRAAADGLTERRKLLVDALFYQSPRTYEEVSRQTGLPIGSIGPTRGRTLRELHRRLCEPGCVACSDQCRPAKIA
jgi:RNA polymerase sigma factor (sigma-70 family)